MSGAKIIVFGPSELRLLAMGLFQGYKFVCPSGLRALSQN
jgi:hypothetical protein